MGVSQWAAASSGLALRRANQRSRPRARTIGVRGLPAVRAVATSAGRASGAAQRAGLCSALLCPALPCSALLCSGCPRRQARRRGVRDGGPAAVRWAPRGPGCGGGDGGAAAGRPAGRGAGLRGRGADPRG